MFPENLSSGLSILFHGIISLPDATSYDNNSLYLLYSKSCVKWPLKNRQNKDLNDVW